MNENNVHQVIASIVKEDKCWAYGSLLRGEGSGPTTESPLRQKGIFYNRQLQFSQV